MPDWVPDERIERLEALAAHFYHGYYVLIDEPVGDLLGKKGLKADIVVSTTPRLGSPNTATIVLVSFGAVGTRPLPAEWMDVLECSREKPWKIDLYVPRADVLRVRVAARALGSQAKVFPLPHDTRNQLLTKSMSIVGYMW